jgi:hypothetical protein
MLNSLILNCRCSQLNLIGHRNTPLVCHLPSAIGDWRLAIRSRAASLVKLLPAVLLISLASLQPSLAADAPKAAKWESLFNGKDLTGWVPVYDVTFVVTNSNLRLVDGTGWLRTEKQYADFVLEAEWRALVPGYDSGFFVRAGLEGKPWPKDGWQVNLGRSALGALVKGYKTVVPAETPPMPLNKWVKFRMEVRGKTITLDVDGERAWEYKELDADRGYIGLQAEGKSFDFRNIRVQELPR